MGLNVGAEAGGVIYTIGPFILPDLVRQMITHTPQMLDNHLRTGRKTCASVAGKKG